jgi:acetate kinase
VAELSPPTAARAPVLTVNAGSTSTKLALVDNEATWTRTLAAGAEALEVALGEIQDTAHDVAAVGHRIVHGGSRFVDPVLVDDEVLVAINAASELAPLHNQVGLTGIELARAAFPHAPQVACFDTAFHATIPPAASTYGGPRRWLEQGYRRYGFHGLSHQHAATRAAELLGRSPDDLHLVSCHLGGGCSVTAVAGGHSVDTTMGFTPLEGLVMGTRAGSVDPGLLLHILRQGVCVDELGDTLEHDSGLLGLSGVSSDLREVITARDGGNADAQLAIDVFVHRIASGIGAMIAALDGVDALVFTGGIGEHSPELRARATTPFAWLGASIDQAANTDPQLDADIATPDAAVRILVVESREDLVLARAAQSLIA